MYMDAKKLLNQKYYSMKHKKITKIEIEDVKIELQGNQRNHIEERKEEKQECLGTTRDDEEKPNATFTAEEEMETLQQKEKIYKLKEKN
jgi:hypothetical protein